MQTARSTPLMITRNPGSFRTAIAAVPGHEPARQDKLLEHVRHRSGEWSPSQPYSYLGYEHGKTIAGAAIGVERP
jgi:hypothetical protein